MRKISTLALLAVLLAVALPANASAVSIPWDNPNSRICPKASKGWNSKALIGKRLGKATRIAARHGCTVRVLRKNGRDLAGTDDYRIERVNVAIRGKQNRVVRILSVG